MYQETNKEKTPPHLTLALLQYLLYCCGPELNLKYLWGMPVLTFWVCQEEDHQTSVEVIADKGGLL